LVKSAACIPGASATELWLLVERTVGGVQRRYVERMSDEFWPDEGAATPTAAALFMDCAITYSGAPAAAITGLAHLEGRTVQVLADGATHPDRVVTGGSITLMRPASLVRVGLRADAMIRPLDISAGAQDGTSSTRKRRVHEVGLLLYQSLGFDIGFYDARRDVTVTDRIETRRPSAPMDKPPPMITGTLVVKVPSDWQDQCQIEIRSEQPLPLTLVGLAPRIQTN
jgi:hypothetical protein